MKPILPEEGGVKHGNGCILCDARVLLLSQLQAKVVEEIQEGHPGISQLCKELRLVTLFECTPEDEGQELPDPPEKPTGCYLRLQPSPRIGQKSCVIMSMWTMQDQLRGMHYISLWMHTQSGLKVYTVPSTTSLAAIGKLQATFVTHGLLEDLVSGNGTEFFIEGIQRLFVLAPKC